MQSSTCKSVSSFLSIANKTGGEGGLPAHQGEANFCLLELGGGRFDPPAEPSSRARRAGQGDGRSRGPARRGAERKAPPTVGCPSSLRRPPAKAGQEGGGLAEGAGRARVTALGWLAGSPDGARGGGGLSWATAERSHAWRAPETRNAARGKRPAGHPGEEAAMVSSFSAKVSRLHSRARRKGAAGSSPHPC